MKVSDYLFFLIKSLTGNEKRHFKLNSNFHSGEGKHYIQMFDVIDRMDYRYREDELLGIFGGDKKKLSISKNFLYNKILRTLRNYNERSSIHTELSNFIEEARILIEKGLMYPALKRLKKAKKIALNYDEQWFLLKIADYELEINKTISRKDILASIDEIVDEGQSALAEYKNTFELKHLSHKLHAKFIVGEYKDLENEVSKIHNYADSYDSFHSKSYYYLTLSWFSWTQQDFLSQNKYLKQLVDLWMSNPKIANSNGRRFIIYLGNYLQNVSHLELIYFIQMSQLDKAVEIIPDIERSIIFYEELIAESRKISFYYNITILYFLLRKLTLAKKWLNKILYDPKSEVGSHVKRFAWILELIIHGEMENYEVVKHIFNDARNPLNLPNPHPFEELSFSHLKKIFFSLKGRRELFRKFQRDLDKYGESNTPFGLEILSMWLESKITDKSFVEVHGVHNKSNQQSSS